MRNTFSELAYDITQIIKGSGRVILMYDEDGNRTYDQKNAAKIFAYPDKMMIIITDDGIDSSVDIALSQNTDVLELQDFINTLRHLCTNYNVLFNIQKYGKEIEPKDFANYGNNTSSDLNECLEYYNKNREIINELFKGDSDVEIEKIDDETYQFIIDDERYDVFLDKNEIYFSNNSSRMTPTGNNKNQFIILNSVLRCIGLIFQNTNKDYYYFSGSNKNGLAKLYTIMFNRLKNESKNYDMFPLATGSYYYDNYETDWMEEIGKTFFYFIRKNSPDYVLNIIDAAKEQNLPFVNQLKESRIDELFKGDSGVEIIKTGQGYEFEIDFILYQVYTRNGEIYFANMDADDAFQPSKNNKNQFLVLNTVITCVEKILETKEIYFFSGSNENGLGKLYSIMFNRLKNKAVSMGYVTLECGEHHFDEDSLFDTDYKPFKKINGEEYFWFIPKEMMTDYVYDEAEKLGIEVTGYN